MCLGEIGRVSAVGAANALRVEVGERAMTVSGMLLDVVPREGDWVLVHAGFAIRQLSHAEACESLAARNEAGRFR